MGQRLLERLGHIVGMDVVDGLETEVGESYLFALGQSRKDVDIEVAGRVHRSPSRTDDVPRVEHGARQYTAAGLAQEQLFDG